jgi:hypothetical protein
MANKKPGRQFAVGDKIKVNNVDLPPVAPLRWRHYGGLRYAHRPEHIALPHR